MFESADWRKLCQGAIVMSPSLWSGGILLSPRVSGRILRPFWFRVSSEPGARLASPLGAVKTNMEVCDVM